MLASVTFLLYTFLPVTPRLVGATGIPVSLAMCLIVTREEKIVPDVP